MNSALVKESNQLLSLALAKLGHFRTFHLIKDSATFAAIAAAAQVEAKRDKGFEGTALAAPHKWWGRFEDHNAWP